MGEIGKTSMPQALSETRGPWPFITYHRLYRPGRQDHTWQSRHHRKNLRELGSLGRQELRAHVARSFVQPQNLNWWIAFLFAIGSSLFIAGCLLSLFPAFAAILHFDGLATNATYFVGSVPFTSAAFLQFYQANQAAPPEHQKTGGLGWRLQSIGWLGCALQFAGTVLFNINTFDGIWPAPDRLHYNFGVWVPNLLGSILFLSSGYLAFIEVGHKYWVWQPKNLCWLVTFINLLGCIAFMISAVFAFEPAHPFGFDAATASVVFTLIGAVAFLIGSVLMMPEGAK